MDGTGKDGEVAIPKGRFLKLKTYSFKPPSYALNIVTLLLLAVIVVEVDIVVVGSMVKI